MLPVEQPFKPYTDLDGKPLQDGFIYFGQPNQNPATAPITVFWDAAGTIPAAQPLRTRNGYILRAGTPANVFFSGAYSELVLDAKKQQVFYARTSDEFSIATVVSNFINNLVKPTGAAFISFIQDGAGALLRNLLDKLRETKSIDDYDSLRAALDALGGPEKTGFGARPMRLDFLGKTVDFTGTIYWPINVSPVNGGVNSTSGRLVLRNPFLANPAVRGYTEYWKDMKVAARDFTFNCQVIVNCFIGASFDNCDFAGSNASVIHVNSNNLWTEYNTYRRCFFASNATVGAAILHDGNVSGTSLYSTGTGAGRPDGSFGYTKYIASKIDSTAPAVGLKVMGGGVLYNGKIGFDGYARGAGGGCLYVINGQIAHCELSLNLESFGAASNIISLDAAGTLAYCNGKINSASPEMTFAQAATGTVTNCELGVTGAVLQDKTGTQVPFGDTVQAPIRTHLLKRLDYFSGNTYNIDTLVGGTVAATGSLESRVPITGQLTLRPNDTRSSSSRNWAFGANKNAFGDLVLMESAGRADDPVTVRMQVQSGGACFNTTGTWGVLSDARLKENVVEARGYLADLRKLRVVRYSLIEDDLDHPNLLGVIAQEVEQVFPAMVSTSTDPETGEETKRVKSSVLTFMLLKAMQEQADRIDDLQSQINAAHAGNQ